MSKPYQTKEFIKLQSDWYKKLKDSGFEDLEVFFPSNGKGEYAPHLKRPNAPQSSQTYDDVVNYNRFLEHYLHNYPNFSPLRLKILTLHLEGQTIRQISHALRVEAYGVNYLKHKLKRKKRLKFSIFKVFTELKTLVSDAILWNKNSPEGLLNENNLDDILENPDTPFQYE